PLRAGPAGPASRPRRRLPAATPADLMPTWRYRRLEGVSRWLIRAPRTVEDYRGQFEAAHMLAKTLIVELRGEVVGALMVTVEDGWAQAEVLEQAQQVQAELGWVLDPARGGH